MKKYKNITDQFGSLTVMPFMSFMQKSTNVTKYTSMRHVQREVKNVAVFPVRSLLQIYFLNKFLHLEILYTDTKGSQFGS